MNASTEWRRETLVKKRRARNRLAANLNRRGMIWCLTERFKAIAGGVCRAIGVLHGVQSEHPFDVKDAEEKHYPLFR